MRKTQKWLAIAVIIAVIGLALTACDNGTTDPCASGHAFPEWTAPTCTVAGNSVRTCTRCTQTDTRTEGYTALGHEGVGAVPATCTTEGNTGTGTCTRCSAEVTGETIPVDHNAHNFGDNWLPTTTASWCVDGVCGNGVETLTCTLCPTTNGTRPAGCLGTQGLVFVSVNGGEAYEVGDNSELEVAQVCIPDYHNGKPVVGIGDYAFNDCCCIGGDWGPNEIITSVRIGVNVTYIGYQAFYYCTSLISITVPASVTYIGEYAFDSCTNLETVIFAEGSQLETIDEGAFYGAGITGITIPASVTSISDWAFGWCEKLEIVTFASGSQLETIGEHAFSGTAITGITIPAGVTSIGGWAFGECENLETVTFTPGSQLETIGNQAFSWSGLTNITIPASVAYIGSQAFSGTTNLTNIQVDSNNQHFQSHEGIVYNKTLTEIAAAPGGIISVTIPASFTYIGNNAFAYCEKLETVIFALGSQLETIGESVFEGCTSLTGITIPANVTSIGAAAFRFSGLTSITIPAGVTSIGAEAFTHCLNLETVIFAPGSQLETIGDFAFAVCGNLKTVTFLAETPPILSWNVFWNTHDSLQIRVPTGSVSAYQTAWGSLLPAPGASRIVAIP